MGAHQRLDRRRVDPGEGGLRKSARRSESVLTLLTFPRFYLGKYPRGESNSHLRFRKPPFYPLNYRDAKAKISGTFAKNGAAANFNFSSSSRRGTRNYLRQLRLKEEAGGLS